MPFPSRIPIEFKLIDKGIIFIISELGGKVGSITRLRDELKIRGRDEALTSINNRISKLEELGLIRASGEREKIIELTEIGAGVAAGLEDITKSSELLFSMQILADPYPALVD